MLIKKIKDVEVNEWIRPDGWHSQPFAKVIALDIKDGHALCIMEVPDLGTVPIEFHENDEMEIGIPGKEPDSIIGGGGDGFEDEGK